MKLSYTWLLEYCKTHYSPEELADRLRTSTCEVESIDDWSQAFSGLVVGKVLSVTQHPNADRLKIASVAISNQTTLTIVCGAPDLAKDQVVVVATSGTVLHPLKGEPFTIEPTTIRGQYSEGMLCGAEEIGLPIPTKGLLQLPPNSTIGSSFAEAYGLNDTVLDLEITPNRPDLLSYVGIAREISTFEKKGLTEPVISSLEHVPTNPIPVTVSIEDSRLCNRFSAVCVDNITVTTSPLWLQSKLLLSGIRPINTVVDVTNYVMLELGQPLHVYDADALLGTSKSIDLKVRTSKTGETLETLDDKHRTLEKNDIVVTSDGKVVDLAGVMGGKSTAVNESSTRILIESAYFLGSSIRKTSRRLGLRSEASGRFEKELDPELTVTALKRAVHLLQEVCGATLASTLIDTYPKARNERPRIHVSFARIQQVLGVHISAPEAEAILHYLGFQIPSLNKSSFDVVPPSWRRDISIPEDIIEELIRIWGFERLPHSMPSSAPKPPTPNRIFRLRQATRRVLSSLGYHETIHLSFTSAKGLTSSGFQLNDAIKLPNPLSEETQFLIPSHLIHFLENISGVNRSITEIKLFESGHVFSPPIKEVERTSLILRTSQSSEHAYRQAKSDCDRLLRSLGLMDMSVEYVQTDAAGVGLQKGSCLQILCQKTVVGYLGLVDTRIVQEYKIRQGTTILFLELDTKTLLSLPSMPKNYVAPSQYPSSERDITLIVDESVQIQAILSLIDSATTEILKTYTVLDIYTGKPLAVGKKSVSIRFTYNATTRTLTDTEVTADQEKLSQLLRETLPAVIN